MELPLRHFLQLALAAASVVAFLNLASACSADRAQASVTARKDARPEFTWPVRGRLIVGCGSNSLNGINVYAPEGTPINAAADGVVAYAGNELKDYGNLVLVRHPNGFVTAYAHAEEILVQRDEQVKRGQVIAKLGQTGNVYGPQLHFEIRRGSKPVNPMDYLPQLRDVAKLR